MKEVRRIVIDPGHGGGTGVRVDEIYEDEIVLRIARDLHVLLNSEINFRSILTRVNDVEKPFLKDRCNLSNEINADLYISLHLNGFNNTFVSGIETWVYDTPSELGDIIHKHVKFFSNDRGVKSSVKEYRPQNGGLDLYVLRYTRCPAVLVELGFLTCIIDRARLVEYKTHKLLAEALFNGVMEYFKKCPQ
jgi:N-acetylmuramoyl-L-alanine amidase